MSTPGRDLPRLDETSLLVHAAGDARLDELDSWLGARGFGLCATLDANTRAWTLATWLGEGAPGAATGDPVDHLVAGFTARDRLGRALELSPCPRRSTGPDWLGLVLGQRGRYVTVEAAHLRIAARPLASGSVSPVSPLSAIAPPADAPPRASEPALSEAERALFDELDAQLHR